MEDVNITIEGKGGNVWKVQASRGSVPEASGGIVVLKGKGYYEHKEINFTGILLKYDGSPMTAFSSAMVFVPLDRSRYGHKQVGTSFRRDGTFCKAKLYIGCIKINVFRSISKTN